MKIPPTIITAKPRVRRKRHGAATSPPTPPPVPAVVVDAFLGEGGEIATLVFDRPVAIAGPFNFGDGSIQFSDQNPLAVSVIDPNSLEFTTGSVLSPGSGWAVNGQPGWLTTVVAVPQNGNFPE
jgi:hypothetical protein